MNKLFTPEPCPLCDGGTWKPYADGTYQFRHGRKSHSVSGQHYAICDKCGTRGYLPRQRDANQHLIREYQKTLLGYISPSNVLAVREKYLLTQEQAGIIFGGGKQGFSKWECGKATPAGPTARLIKLALKFPTVMLALAAEAGIQLPETARRGRRITDKTEQYASESSVEVTRAKSVASVVTWTPNPGDFAPFDWATSIVEQGVSVPQKRRIVMFEPKQVGVSQARWVDLLREQGGSNVPAASEGFIGTATFGEDRLTLVLSDDAVNPLTGALFPTSTNSATSTSRVTTYGNQI